MKLQLFHGTSKEKAQDIEKDSDFKYFRLNESWFNPENLESLSDMDSQYLPGTIGYGVYAFDNEYDAMEFSLKRERQSHFLYYVSFEICCDNREILDCDCDTFHKIMTKMIENQDVNILKKISKVEKSIRKKKSNNVHYKDISYGILIEMVMNILKSLGVPTEYKILKKKTQTKKNNVPFLESYNYTNTIEYCIRDNSIIDIDSIRVRRGERK